MKLDAWMWKNIYRDTLKCQTDASQQQRSARRDQFIQSSLLWSFIAIILGGAGIARACEVVKPDLTINGDPLIVINRPGKYCIDQDCKFLCYPWRHSCSGKFLDVRGNNIDIDMRGHSLISINAPGYEGAYLIGSNIALRNGKIESGGTAVRMRSPGSPPFSVKYYDRSPMALPAYYAGNFVLENLTIRGEESVSAVGFSGIRSITLVGFYRHPIRRGWDCKGVRGSEAGFDY